MFKFYFSLMKITNLSKPQVRKPEKLSLYKILIFSTVMLKCLLENKRGDIQKFVSAKSIQFYLKTEVSRFTISLKNLRENGQVTLAVLQYIWITNLNKFDWVQLNPSVRYLYCWTCYSCEGSCRICCEQKWNVCPAEKKLQACLPWVWFHLILFLWNKTVKIVDIHFRLILLLKNKVPEMKYPLLTVTPGSPLFPLAPLIPGPP